jgi:hypothetical protein
MMQDGGRTASGAEQWYVRRSPQDPVADRRFDVP